MKEKKENPYEFSLYEWLSSMRSYFFISFLISCLLIIGYYKVLPEHDFGETIDNLNSILRDCSFILIASLFTMVAIFQAIRSSNNNELISKITDRTLFKMMVANEYYTVCALIFVIILTLFFSIIDSFSLEYVVIVYLILETWLFLNCLFLSLKHFKIITRLF